MARQSRIAAFLHDNERRLKRGAIVAALTALLTLPALLDPLPHSKLVDALIAQGAGVSGLILLYIGEFVLPVKAFVALQTWAADAGRPVLLAATMLLFFAPLVWVIPSRRLDWLWPSWPVILDPVLEKPGAPVYDPFSAGSPLRGREDQKRELEAFLVEDGRAFAAMTIHGGSGVGKTRLALEIMKQARAGRLGSQHPTRASSRRWDTGHLKPEITRDQAAGTTFKRRTVILIDEWENTTDLWLLLEILHRCARPGRPVRVLLTGPYPLARPARAELAVLCEACSGVLGLEPIDEETCIAIAADNWPDETLSEILDKAEGRPLFAVLGRDPWGRLSEIARKVLDKAGALMGEDGEKLLVMSALAGPVTDADRERLLPGTGDIAKLASLFEGATRSTLRAGIPRLSHNLIAEAVVLEWISGRTPATVEAWIGKLIAIEPDTVAQRIDSIWRERPEAERAARLLLHGTEAAAQIGQDRYVTAMLDLHRQRQPDWRDAVLRQTREAFEDLHSALSETSHSPLPKPPLALSRLKFLATAYPADLEIMLELARGMYTATVLHAAQRDSAAMANALTSLTEVSARFEGFVGDASFAIWLAQGLVNASLYATLTNDAATLETTLADLAALSARFEGVEGDASIALSLAEGLVNASLYARNTKDAVAIENAIARLAAVSRRFKGLKGDAAIAFSLARGLVNATKLYGELTNEAGLKNALTCLIAVSTRFEGLEGDAGVALMLAQGLSNATLLYINRPEDATALNDVLTRLMTVSDRFKGLEGDAAVAHSLAKGLANAIELYAEHTKDEVALKNVLARLVAVSGRFKGLEGDAAIALELARGLFNATVFFIWRPANATVFFIKRPEDSTALLKRILVRLIAVSSRFKNNAAIAVMLAKGLANATALYNGRLEDALMLERVLACLAAVSALFKGVEGDAGVALELARGLYNAALLYNDRLEDAAALENVLARLAAVSARLMGDDDIAFEFARGLVAGTLGAERTGEFSARSFRINRLAHLARSRPFDTKIQNFIKSHYPDLVYLEQEKRGWPYGVPSAYRPESEYREPRSENSTSIT